MLALVGRLSLSSLISGHPPPGRLISSCVAALAENFLLHEIFIGVLQPGLFDFQQTALALPLQFTAVAGVIHRKTVTVENGELLSLIGTRILVSCGTEARSEEAMTNSLRSLFWPRPM